MTDETAKEAVRVAPGDHVDLRKSRLINRTSNSILVKRDNASGRFEIVDCCLEEQGK